MLLENSIEGRCATFIKYSAIYKNVYAGASCRQLVSHECSILIYFVRSNTSIKLSTLSALSSTSKVIELLLALAR